LARAVEAVSFAWSYFISAAVTFILVMGKLVANARVRASASKNLTFILFCLIKLIKIMILTKIENYYVN
jgi:hypothetical protein